MELNKTHKYFFILVGMLVVGVLLSIGNKVAYNLLAIIIYALWMIRTYILDKRKNLASKMTGVYLIFAYTLLISLQYVYFAIFSKNYSITSFFYFLHIGLGYHFFFQQSLWNVFFC